MKYHITITNNETCEILIDEDTDCIIGACNNEQGTRVMSFARCAQIDRLATVAGALEAGERNLRGLTKKERRFLRKLAKKEARKNA